MEGNTYVEFYINHKNCPLLELKQRYGDQIKKTSLIGDVSKGNSKWHGLHFSVDTNSLDSFCNDLERTRQIRPIDRVLKADESDVYCYVQDDVFTILSEVNGSRTGFPSLVPQYDLVANYGPFGKSAEHFQVSLPHEKYFLGVVDKLYEASKEKKLDWRIYTGIQQKRIPGVSLLDQYIYEQALNTQYFETLDLKDLRSLSGRLKMKTEVLRERADAIWIKLCRSFVSKFRNIPEYNALT